MPTPAGASGSARDEGLGASAGANHPPSLSRRRAWERNGALPLTTPRTGTDVDAPIPPTFRLQSGERLAQTHVRGRISGAPGAPVILVAGGISSGCNAVATDDGSPGWWPWVVTEGGPVDTSRARVLAFDFAPAGEPPNSVPVTITTHDQARLAALLLDHLDIRQVAAIVGCSYGGMVALAFAELFSARVGRLVVFSAADRAHPMATALRGIQRRIVQFGIDSGRADEGVALARELSMTTYRSEREFAERFDAAAAPAPARAGERYAVCEYLGERGRAYPAVMAARRWIALSDSIDRHRVDPARIAAPVTLVSIASDRVVPQDDMRSVATRLPGLVRLVEADSLYGHDAFLKERWLVEGVLREALAPVFAPTAAAA